jgi:hypothetical protein
MNEDRCRVRAGARPLAKLRNLVTCVIRRRALAIPKARDNFLEDHADSIKVVKGQVL